MNRQTNKITYKTRMTTTTKNKKERDDKVNKNHEWTFLCLYWPKRQTDRQNIFRIDDQIWEVCVCTEKKQSN